MTIIDPTYLAPVAPLNPADVGFATIGTMQPFSPRAGIGYQDLLETLRVYVQNDLYNFLTASNPQTVWDGNVDKLVQAIADQLNAQEATVNAALQAAVQQIASGTNADLYDAQIKTGLQATNSVSLAFLLAQFTPDFAPIATQQKVDRRPYVIPEDYVQAGDNGDWALAIHRALLAATPIGASVLLGQLYACKTTITLASNDSLIGLGRRTGVQAPNNAPIVLLSGNGINGVHLENFTVDGNALTTQTKSYARAVQFINCNKLKYFGMNVRYTPDWGTSFEQCTDVHIRDYTFEAGNTSGAAGAANSGRDGLHILDGNDVLIDGVRGHSHDDLIGITTKTMNSARIRVRNVTGISEIAAVVTLGMETGTAFSFSEVSIKNVNTQKSTDFAAVSSYGVKIRAQNGGKITNLDVANVDAIASQYALWIDALSDADVDGVNLSNIRGVSTGQHGVILSHVFHINATNVYGQSTTATTDGLHFQYCQFGTIHGGGSIGSGMWGVQLNTCVSLDLWGLICRDNGGAAFSGNNGGNLRTSNTTNCNIYGGQYAGAATTSYFGKSNGGDTGLNLTAVPPTFAGAH